MPVPACRRAFFDFQEFLSISLCRASRVAAASEAAVRSDSAFLRQGVQPLGGMGGGRHVRYSHDTLFQTGNLYVSLVYNAKPPIPLC